MLQGIECDLCKLAVQWVDREIASNRSVAAINNTLDGICQSLSGEIGALVCIIQAFA